MHSFANQRCEAVFSACATYRFWVAREWGAFGTFGVFLCHNPSSADALWLDMTTLRCNNLAVHWKWRGFGIVNVLPLITSNLAAARTATIPPAISAINDDWLRRSRSLADIFVIAVGADGHKDAINAARRLVPPFHAIGKNADGTYLHPAAKKVHNEKMFTVPEPISFL